MQQDIFISANIFLLVVAALIGVFAQLKNNKNIFILNTICFFLSIVFAAYNLYENVVKNIKSTIDLKWFELSKINNLKLTFDLSFNNSIFWLIIATLFLITSIFIYQDQKDKKNQKTLLPLYILPLYCLALLVGFWAQNFLVYELSSIIFIYASFLNFCFSKDENGNLNRSQVSFNYLINTLMGEFLQLIGFLGLYFKYNVIDFEQLNIKMSADSESTLLLIVLLLGLILKNLQVPLIKNIFNLSYNNHSSFTAFAVTQIVFSGIIFEKVSSSVFQQNGFDKLSIIPLLSCVFSAMICLATQNKKIFLSFVLAYFLANQAFCWLRADAVSAFSYMLFTPFSFLLISITFFNDWKLNKYLKWFLIAGTLGVAGFPGFSLAWSKQSEYLNHLAAAKNFADWHWIIYLSKLISDFIFLLAVFTFVRQIDFENKDEKPISSKIDYLLLVTTSFAFIFNISLITHGSILSSVFGSFDQVDSVFLSWFNKLISSYAIKSNASSQAQDLILINATLLSSTIFIALCASYFWLFKTKEDLVNFKNKITTINNSLFLINRVENKQPNLFLKNAKRQLFLIAEFLNEVILVEFINSSFLFLKKSLSYIARFDNWFFVRIVYDGSAKAFMYVASGLKFIQNKDAQYYFMIGFAVTVLFFVKFIFFGGSAS